MSPVRRQVVVYTNLALLSICTHIQSNGYQILIISIQKMYTSMSSAKWRQFSLGLIVLKTHYWNKTRVRIIDVIDNFVNQMTWRSCMLCRKLFISDDLIRWEHFPRDWSLWGESTSHRWIPLTKASDAGPWCFLWSAPEQTVEQTPETPVIWDPIALIMTSL